MAERDRALFSIGAVARMLDVTPATIRTWETRYGLVRPQRSGGGQRLYSREQVEQLRYVKVQVDGGRRPAEAHRLLAERIARGDSFGGTRVRVMLAEGRLGAAHVLRELLGGEEGFDVLVAEEAAPETGARGEPSPTLVVVDTVDLDFDALADRLRASGTRILPLDVLDGSLGWLEEATSLLPR